MWVNFSHMEDFLFFVSFSVDGEAFFAVYFFLSLIANYCFGLYGHDGAEEEMGE